MEAPNNAARSARATEITMATEALPILLRGMRDPSIVILRPGFSPAFSGELRAGRRHNSAKKINLIAGTKNKSTHHGLQPSDRSRLRVRIVPAQMNGNDAARSVR